jgi:hypothetical protein
MNSQNCTKPTTEEMDLDGPVKDYDLNGFRQFLAEVVLRELKLSLRDATKKLLSNDQKIEEMEEKIRNYEDQIKCLELLVCELQQMLRSLLETEEIERAAARPETEAALVEVSLEDETPPEQRQRKEKTRRVTGDVRRLLIGPTRRTEPKKSEVVESGSLSDFQS